MGSDVARLVLMSLGILSLYLSLFGCIFGIRHDGLTVPVGGMPNDAFENLVFCFFAVGLEAVNYRFDERIIASAAPAVAVVDPLGTIFTGSGERAATRAKTAACAPTQGHPSERAS
jgi:hypothetical protein